MAFKRGTIKVINSANGSRIQEDTGDSIRIWTAEEWAAEVARRIEEDKKAPVEEKVKKTKKEKEIDSLIQDDIEEDDADEVINLPKTPKKAKGK